jgi:flagellin
MHISTLNRHNDLEDTRASASAAQTAAREPSEVQAALQAAIANLKVSSENVTASDSHLPDTEMAPEMLTFTRSRILRQAGAETLAHADAVPQTVLDLLR